MKVIKSIIAWLCQPVSTDCATCGKPLGYWLEAGPGAACVNHECSEYDKPV